MDIKMTSNNKYIYFPFFVLLFILPLLRVEQRKDVFAGHEAFFHITNLQVVQRQHVLLLFFLFGKEKQKQTNKPGYSRSLTQCQHCTALLPSPQLNLNELGSWKDSLLSKEYLRKPSATNFREPCHLCINKRIVYSLPDCKHELTVDCKKPTAIINQYTQTKKSH